MPTGEVPVLDGVHHVKLPVVDLPQSIAWYHDRLGYEVEVEFVEHGQLAGVSMRHPNGGPRLALRQDAERCRAASGFDYFSIGVPDKASIDDLAERLTELGDAHAGVHFAGMGWILPELHDPNGHEVRFYTTSHHDDAGPDGPLQFEDVRETSEERERAYRRTQ
jgi:catechol 2,3-dioxygenase-like lactoylglutathione lyase family enzyme